MSLKTILGWAAVAFIVPETPSVLVQLKLTGFVPDSVEPNPVPIVVQPGKSGKTTP